VSVSLDDLRAVVDFEASAARVEAVAAAAAADLPTLVRFVGRYTSWNGFFGAGVATLAGRIARSRRLFLEPGVPVAAVADRSVLVASYFFDAAVDEFDDRSTRHRDTHRCLAQAAVLGVLDYAVDHGPPELSELDHVNALLAEPDWLIALNAKVATGYGHGMPETAPALFRSMGYHLGSEVLADEEFSVLDAALHRHAPAVVAHLESVTVEVGGERHEGWKWFRVHSGHGGGAEADHFAWAVEGVERAFGFSDPAQREALRAEVLAGFREFAADHDQFFAKVLG
jgi:hypothetical protein